MLPPFTYNRNSVRNSLPNKSPKEFFNESYKGFYQELPRHSVRISRNNCPRTYLKKSANNSLRSSLRNSCRNNLKSSLRDSPRKSFMSNSWQRHTPRQLLKEFSCELSKEFSEKFYKDTFKGLFLEICKNSLEDPLGEFLEKVSRIAAMWKNKEFLRESCR